MPRSFRRLSAMTVVLLAGCAAAVPTAIPTAVPTASPAIVAPTATARPSRTPPPTATRAPTLTPSPYVRPARALTPSALDALPQWDLLLLSDSTGWFVADALAERIARERGVRVVVHSITVGGLSAVDVRHVLQGGEFSDRSLMQLPALLPEAEFIVLALSPLAPGPDHPTLACLNPAPYKLPPCGPEAFAAYEADLNAIYDAIGEARAGQPTIVRGFGLWHRPGWWREGGVEADCGACIEQLNDARRRVAAAHGSTMADVAAAFNGPDYQLDPQDRGYLGGDDEHANDVGAAVIAEAILALGYEAATP